MPGEKQDGRPASSPLDTLSEAWDQLTAANDALAAALQTGSREFASVGMRVLRARIGQFDRAVAQLLDEAER